MTWCSNDMAEDEQQYLVWNMLKETKYQSLVDFWAAGVNIAVVIPGNALRSGSVAVAS